MPNLYETIIQISILGTEPYTGDLSDISDDVITGDFSGKIVSQTERVIQDRAEQQKLCDNHATDLEFFGVKFKEEDDNDSDPLGEFD